MPELPEVEAVRREGETRLADRTIRHVIADDSRSILSGIRPAAFVRSLSGRRIRGLGRRGKYFWWELDDGRWLLMHLGMTGWIEYVAQGERLPRFARVVFELDDGTHVAFTDSRRFGKIRLLEVAPEATLPVKRLGLDPLQEIPSATKLREVFQRRRIAIKTLLLDQAVFAGVGNWIADEVLYQAGIRPHRLCPTLSLAETRALRTHLHRILETAVEKRADDREFPRHWLFHHRWGRRKGARTARGEAIRHDTVGGRTTAWVPTRQR